ncbi:MAG: hypothetical protein G01um10148_492 [Parcubacteria group bacterium Gr01-1014_8]|nr:MAG: hypothetical protein G01um10148_492 [Parcubacteria group bacterium Gr01-1014_8]
MTDKAPVVRDYLDLEKLPDGWKKAHEYVVERRSELQRIYDEEGQGKMSVNFVDQFRETLKAMRNEPAFSSLKDYFVYESRRGKPVIYSSKMLEIAYERTLRNRFPQRYR